MRFRLGGVDVVGAGRRRHASVPLIRAGMEQMSVDCDLGEIPIWRGAQRTPALQCAPFGFALDGLGLVRLKSPDIVARMVEAYARDDYQFITSPPGSSDWGNELAQRSLNGLEKLYFESCGSGIAGLDVLELGGGTTYCSQYLIEKMDAASVTLVDPAVRENADHPNLHVRREYFTDETVLEKPSRLIVSFNTLEHVSDPVAFLAAARRHLADDGLIFLKMPECGKSLAKGNLGLCVHEHLSYFTLASLDTLLAYVGLERVGEANYLGALQIIARKGSPDPEAHCDSTSHLLAAFAANAEAPMDRLKRFATGHRGRRVAFVGASVGLCNVLHLSGIGKLMQVEIFDGDSLKTGRFLPGFERPIMMTDDPRLESHEHIFITPVNFFDEIRAGLEKRPGLAQAQIHAVFRD